MKTENKLLQEEIKIIKTYITRLKKEHVRNNIIVSGLYNTTQCNNQKDMKTRIQHLMESNLGAKTQIKKIFKIGVKIQ